MDMERIAQAIDNGSAKIKKAAKHLIKIGEKYEQAIEDMRELKKEHKIALREFQDSLKPEIKQAKARNPKPDPIPEPLPEPQPIVESPVEPVEKEKAE